MRYLCSMNDQTPATLPQVSVLAMQPAHRVWVYAGTFDPLTSGHLDVITRAAPHCDQLIIAVVDRPNHKSKGLLTTAERVQLCKEATEHIGNVVVEAFTGILVEFARSRGATALVRGLRTVTDFEYEFGIGQLNRMLDAGIETFYILCDPQWSFCSSSAVRELHALGGDITPLVPDCVYYYLEAKSANEQTDESSEEAQPETE